MLGRLCAVKLVLQQNSEPRSQSVLSMAGASLIQLVLTPIMKESNCKVRLNCTRNALAATPNQCTQTRSTAIRRIEHIAKENQSGSVALNLVDRRKMKSNSKSKNSRNEPMKESEVQSKAALESGNGDMDLIE